MKMAIRILLLFLLLGSNTQAQVNPDVYYTFDLVNPLAPTTGVTNITPTGAYTINAGGPVGEYVTINRVVNQELRAQALTANTQVSIEFLWKAEHGWDENRDPHLFYWGDMYARFWWPNLRFETSSNLGSNNFAIDLRESGQKTWSYFKKNWHHFVFTYDAVTGIKQVYVDGVLSEGFSDTITAAATIATSTAQQLVMGYNNSFSSGSFSYDEITFYDAIITADQVYSNYLEFTAGVHYTFQEVPAIAADPITAPLDVLEFPLGYTLGDTRSDNVSTDAYEQLRRFPRPRYRIGTDAPKNFNWMGLDYMGGNLQVGYTGAMMRDTSAAMNIELATNWNHYFLVNGNFNSTDYTDTTTWEGRMVAISNRNKQFKTGIISLYNQLYPQEFFPQWQDSDYFRIQTCPTDNYINDGLGGFFQPNGSVGTFRYRSPASPLDSLKIDASTFRRKFQFLASEMTDTLDLINDNDEVLTFLDSTIMRQDPAIVTAMGLAGYGNVNEYTSEKFADMWGLIKDSIRSIPEFSNTAFTIYILEGLDGSVAFQNGIVSRYLLSKYKEVNEDPDFGATTTFSFYPRYPWNWRQWTGAWVGLQPFYESRTVETNTRIKYTTPFVACGWNENEEENMRPAQWLGILKILGMTGSRMFYSGYFYETFPSTPSNPKGYVWQAVTPVYAQAACDWVMDNTYGNDTLMAGDVPINYQAPVSAGWRFYSGSEEIQTVIRKRTGIEQYAIGTAYVNSSNMTGGTPLLDTAVFELAGKTISLETRRQGSVYCLDLNKDTAVFIQYDAWHDYTHPQRWEANDIYVEAEHYGKYISEEEDVRTIPYQSSAGSSFSFFNTTTFLTWRDSASYGRDTMSYQINISSDTTLWLWVKARSFNGTASGFTARMDNLGAFTQNNIVDTAFKWYRVGIFTDTMKWVNLDAGFHTLKLYPTSARTEIDQFLLTNDEFTVLPEGIPGFSDPCTTAVVPVVTPTGPITQCGGSVSLLSTAAAAYSWSNGGTGIGTTVSTSGVYYVITTDNNGCTEQSNAVTVTINAVPPSDIVITEISGNDCIGDSILIESPGGYSSYSWSSGETTQSIYILQSGIYTVTVTNVLGCTSTGSFTSAFTTVTPGITVNSLIAICAGDTVELELNNAYLYSGGYDWFSYPDTTIISSDSILRLPFLTDDTVNVVVIDGNGCVGYNPSPVVIRTVDCSGCFAVQQLTTTEVTSDRAYIEWSPLIRADQFIIYLTNQRRNTTIRSTIGGTRHATTFSGLTPGTSYRYYVQTICDDGTVVDSNSKKFTTKRIR